MCQLHAYVKKAKKIGKVMMRRVAYRQGPDMGKFRPGASRKVPPPTTIATTFHI